MNYKSNEIFQSTYSNEEQKLLSFEDQKNEPISYIFETIHQFEEINEEENYSSLYSNNINPKLSSYIGEKTQQEIIKNDSNDKLSTNSNILIANKIKLKSASKEEILFELNLNIKYRKDAYYKYFKVIFGRFLKNKLNTLKNICFPHYKKNNFSKPNYKFTGNPKEKANYEFLSWKIKEVMEYNSDEKKQNRQYNNKLIIKYIENNRKKAKDKNVYEELISFLNETTLEEVFIIFYEDKNEFEKIKKNKKCIYFDKFFKKETDISLLEKNGFIKAIKRKIENCI